MSFPLCLCLFSDPENARVIFASQARRAAVSSQPFLTYRTLFCVRDGLALTPFIELMKSRTMEHDRAAAFLLMTWRDVLLIGCGWVGACMAVGWIVTAAVKVLG
ncbi:MULTISPECIES: hypothetical protein [unclassified Cupriavidus]|uniref:hypothetical protein n=1 Tax=unclassified Cupriavidus TaxID=2640874 RepID=UPI001C0029CD|nr:MULTISPECIES: hypothetical protein [unclassified Cupriavidus]MCA3184119.1 hypothetical protein [Cupriavidus sp.]MCA3189505.1 hypothetical protein [Cupriavidus sp.]MCA3195585.1 hypothetical protein [Cupriavidus sp.]MCA3201140.1 hypothetical protein [Cupriavidus sp.]MCA3207402.1 hypothetical protein [Cupriavidus sp.]